jgi:hypothetical protein
MAKVEQEVVVKIKTIIDGLNEVKAYADTVKNIGRGSAKSLTSDFLKGGAAAGVANAAVNRLLNGLERLGSVGVDAITSFVAEGIRFNATIESARIGIATLVANTYDVRDAQGTLLQPVDAFNASLEKSEELERAIQKAAILTKFEFQDVLAFFNSTVIASAGLNTNLEQLVRLTQDFALAAGAANVPVEQVNTGIKQILTGYTTVRNPLARVLFPGEGTRAINDQIKKYKEAGTLVDFLEKKLAVFRLSADQVGQSFEAVSSNATDALKVFEAIATLPLFNKIKEALGFIIRQVVDLNGDAVKLTPTFQKIADITATILGFLGDRMLEAVRAIFGGIAEWADYLYQNRDAMFQILANVYAIAEQIALIAVDLISIVGDAGTAGVRTTSWADATGKVAIFVGFIRDLLNVIIGSIEVIVAVGLVGVGTGMSLIGNTLQSIIDKTGAWLNMLIPGAQLIASVLSTVGSGMTAAGGSFAGTGLDRFTSGWDGSATGDALNRMAQATNAMANRATKPYSFSARPSSGSGAGGKGDGGKAGRKRAEDDRRRDAQRLFDEIEKYQIASAERTLQIATESNKALLEIEQQRYEKGILSAEDYYRRKAEIENTDLDNQVFNLKRQSEFAEQALNRDLGAIAGQFRITNEEVSEIIEKIKGLTETPGALEGADKTTLKQAIEYTKYLEQTAAITQKLTLIEQKRKNIQADTTFATEKQARANKTLFDGLAAEFGDASGSSGLGELHNLQKRVADEFPRILTETNKTLPGIKEFANEVYDAAHVDASRLPELLKESGIEFDLLSDEARLFVKLMERLQNLARIKTVGASVDRANSALKFATDGTETDFDNGKINLATALTQTTSAKVTAVKALTAAYNEQKIILTDLQAKGIATPEDIQSVEALQRAINALNSDLDKLALITTQGDRDGSRFSSAVTEVDLRRESGELSSRRAKEQTLALQLQQIAALQEELAALLRLDQTNTQVQQKVAETRIRLGELRNETNADFISFAQGVNGTIGSAFSTFVDSIQDGTQSIGESFKGLLSGLLLGIAKAIAQALLLKFVLAPLGLTGGDSGGIGGLLSGLITGKKADGGIISGGGTGVSDSAGLFALSHGEGVIPARRVRQYGLGFVNSIINGSFLPRVSSGNFANGGFPSGVVEGGRGGGTRIINTLDPNLVSDFMSSAQGEEIIVNVIGKNQGLLQRLA